MSMNFSTNIKYINPLVKKVYKLAKIDKDERSDIFTYFLLYTYNDKVY